MADEKNAAVARPRRWFQLHLATCLVMMLVAGLIVGANMKAQHWGNLTPSNRMDLWFIWGWPARCVCAQRDWSMEGAVQSDIDETVREGERIAERASLFGFDDQPVGPRFILWPRLFCNLGVAAGLLLFVAAGMEWALRRRERAK